MTMIEAVIKLDVHHDMWNEFNMRRCAEPNTWRLRVLIERLLVGSEAVRGDGSTRRGAGLVKDVTRISDTDKRQRVNLLTWKLRLIQASFCGVCV